jgi:hypothetical protein
MSAWIPNREHIDLLASAIDLMRGKIEDHVPLNLDDIGQTLVDEVVESVSFRYPNDNVEAGELPGPLDAYYLKPYRHQPQGFTPWSPATPTRRANTPAGRPAPRRRGASR